jgi:uncharacterized protein
MCALCIHLEDVKDAPRRFHLECDAEDWERVRAGLHDPEARYAEVPTLDLDGHRLGQRLLFRGRMRGALQLDCGRCLEAYRFPLDEEIELLLEPAPKGEEPEGGLELDIDEPGLGRYAGEQLDFAPVVLEAVALAWPIQPLCDENCRGLCAVCGADRNREPCRCESQPHSRPFADLGTMLERARRGRG